MKPTEFHLSLVDIDTNTISQHYQTTPTFESIRPTLVY